MRFFGPAYRSLAKSPLTELDFAENLGDFTFEWFFDKSGTPKLSQDTNCLCIGGFTAEP